MAESTSMPGIVAHRGASAQAPENTLAAFELAWRQGADAIEGDFRLTADGELVCFHDADTKRICGESHLVAGTPLTVLRGLDAGFWRGARWRGMRIPTLAEVLATVPDGKGMVIELKGGVEMLPALARGIGGSALKPEQVTVIAFDREVIRELSLASHGWRLNLLVETRFRLWLPGIVPRPETLIPILRESGAHGVGLRAHPLISRRYINRIRAAGFECHLWTVDSVLSARRWRRMGVQSLTTNVPGRLRAALG
jgi:glycerophosphoryl diester phosphodiesterase